MFEINNYTHLTYLGKLINESMQLPVFFKMNSQLEENFYSSATITAHPFLHDSAELLRSVANQGDKLTGPVIHETIYFEQFAVIPVKQNGNCQAVLVLGPTTRQEANSLIYTEFFKDQGVPVQDREKWTTYWNSLQTIDQMRFLNICVSVNWMINQEILDITDVLQSSLEYGSPGKQKKTVLELAEWRESSLFHDGITVSQQLLDLIRKGNKKELMRQLLNYIHDNNPIEVQSKRSYLRNVKNLAICGIALSSNAAFEGGLYEEMSTTLCDMHIRRIEELNELTLVQAAVFDAIVDFTGRVSQCRNKNLSKAVAASQEFIYLHLYEELKVHHFAEVSGVNPNYLSQLFKKETGLTLMNYVQRERIEEAKKLLDHSKDTISLIGERLHFYDQAYFIKVFKKHTGITPKQYRNR